jgi:hypothetical protein
LLDFFEREGARQFRVEEELLLPGLRPAHGPVGIAAADRKYGHALIGGQGGGKTSCLASHLAIAADDPDRAIVVVDGKGPLAQAALGMIPADRTVDYLDLAAPELGFNPLQIGTTAGATADGFVRALVEANPPGAIQAASDSFLRQAISAVCAVEDQPTLWHVYRMLDFRGQTDYRDSVMARLDRLPGTDFARNYWRREFPALIGDKGFAARALNPPRNKIERLISTHETDLLLRHPHTIDLGQLLQDGQVLIVNAAKANIGEDNARLIMQLLLALLHRQLQTRHNGTEHTRPVTLLFDEAHNMLTPAVATMLAEGRSAGLEAVSPGSTRPRSPTRSCAPACAPCCSPSPSFACAKWPTPARSPGSPWRSTQTTSQATTKTNNGCASRPTTSPASTTTPSTSGWPKARPAPASSPKPCPGKTYATSALPTTTAHGYTVTEGARVLDVWRRPQAAPWDFDRRGGRGTQADSPAR